MERTHILFGFTFLSVLSQALWKFVKIFYHVGNVPEQHTGANFAMIQSLQGSNNMIQSLQGSNIPMIQSIASELKFCMDTNAERGSDGLEEYLPLLLNDELPSSLGQKLKDGFLDTQTAKTLVDTFYKDRHDEKTMANIAINVCHVAAVPDVLNPCEIGFSLKSCFVDSKKKGKELRGRN